jgi:hypothetical protein
LLSMPGISTNNPTMVSIRGFSASRPPVHADFAVLSTLLTYAVDLRCFQDGEGSTACDDEPAFRAACGRRGD